MYAFWNHDAYPFWIGGKITQVVTSKGSNRPDIVKVEGFGGYNFRATYVESDEQGAKTKARMEQLKQEHRAFIQQVDRFFKNQIETEFPWTKDLK